jgi:bifunctional enzyme CysN/CysC
MPLEIFKLATAGSVDDGKSSILARLLLDSENIFKDQIPKDFDPDRIADLLDGLESEREQGITIDVAHRFFDTDTRRYHLTDAPGHSQYTRNMATACAGSHAVLIVLDASQGIKEQTLLHMEIALRLGIRQFVFAINKMDLVRFSKKTYLEIDKVISEHMQARRSLFGEIEFLTIPLSAKKGDNVARKSRPLDWHKGPTLLEAIEGLKVPRASEESVAFQIQLVQRIANGGRRYLGSLLSGQLSQGQILYCENQKFTLIDVMEASSFADLKQFPRGVSLKIDSDIDLSRGQFFTSEPELPVGQFEADLIWLSDDPGRKHQKYILKAGSAIVPCTVTKVSQITLETNKKSGEIQTIHANEIVRVNMSLAFKIALREYLCNPIRGRFVLIDPKSGGTVGVGTVNFELRRSENVVAQDFSVTPKMLEQLTGNKAQVLWLTGLSGSGKSTLANEISTRLFANNQPHFVLDGDNLRHGINRDLGFTPSDRTENIRRTAEVASLMVDAGLIVLVSMVSPMETDRNMARSIIGEERFTLVYLDTPLEICEKRDVKGLYRKAREGKIPNFTGINAPFETPINPEIVIRDSEGFDGILSLLGLPPQ